MFWLYKRRSLVAVIALLIIAYGAGWLLWQHFHPPEPVTMESQQQAETSQGVERAAQKGDVPISAGQSKQIAKEIKPAVHEKPVAVVKTTGKDLSATINKEVKKSGADFAIVTNPKEPDKSVDVKKIPDNQPVILNQYTIHALHAHQWSVGYYDRQNCEVSWQMRIANTGGYIGPSVLHTNGKTYVGVRISGAY
jgi:hypothetical protein